jgi:hypothetical protein
MAQKKPIWTTTAAHARLKEYCAATGRTQLEVVSELILSELDPANPDKVVVAAVPEEKKEAAPPKKDANMDRHFGGVWVV